MVTLAPSQRWCALHLILLSQRAGAASDLRSRRGVDSGVGGAAEDGAVRCATSAPSAAPLDVCAPSLVVMHRAGGGHVAVLVQHVTEGEDHTPNHHYTAQQPRQRGWRVQHQQRERSLQRGRAAGEERVRGGTLQMSVGEMGEHAQCSGGAAV